MKVNPTIFREYDIRGRIDTAGELTNENIEVIGRGFATFLRRRGITDAIVGYDGRPYSKSVKEITTKALLESGINVTEIGQVLVPIFYFAQYFLKKKGGVMITASHNPWGWSGFKHAYDYSATLVPENMRELQDVISREDYPTGGGKLELFSDIIEEYTRDVLGRVKIAKPLRVLIDAGNGTAGPIVPDIFRKAGCVVFEQYTEIKEERHHDANPSTVGMLNVMSEGAQNNKIDVVLGFDDDGDRLGVVDEKGNIVWPDRILALLARSVLKENPGSKIVFDVKMSEGLIEDIKAHGGHPVMWITGHSYIKAKAKEIDAALAGERSGHIFFRRNYYGFDDATFAGLKLLEFLSVDGRPLSEIVKTLPHYFTSPVWHVPCADEKKYDVVKKLTEELKQEYGAEKVVDINGARVYLEDGWGLVRASSNIPALVLVFEAKTEEGLKKIESVFREKLSRYEELGNEWTSG